MWSGNSLCGAFQMPATVHYRACNLCEAICGLAIRTEGDRILSIKGDPDDPFSRGHICPKAVALQDIQNDPDRLRTPMRRVGSGWQPVSWDEAIERTADGIAKTAAVHGFDAVATFHGNPNVHNWGLMTHAGAVFGQIKSKNRYSASSTDQLPHQLVCLWMYGHQLTIPIPDIDNTDFFLMLGANPLVSNGSMMTVPGVASRLKALQQRGGRLTVIDPRRTETASIADEHLFIRPGTDLALLLALLTTIIEEGLVRPGRVEAFTDGFGKAAAAIQQYGAEQAATVTGIPATTIRRLAREFAAAPRAICYGRMGVSAQEHGTLCHWLIQLLNIATGNLDRVGGSLVTRPAVDLVAATKPNGQGRWASRVSGKAEALGELPASALAEEISAPGGGQVRALVTVAGNPVLSTPNGRQLDDALATLDFMASLDFYINETTRHAHIILPPTAPLEHDHYDLTFNLFAVRNVARYSAPVLPKPQDALHDWEILQRLSVALAGRLGTELRPAPEPRQILDFGLKAGPYDLSLAALEAAPHGLDLGPLEPAFPERLKTKDGRIDCAPEPLMAALAPAIAKLLSAQPAGLVLIGRRDIRTNNSWMHNSARLVKGKPRCRLFMNPADLGQRGLSHGQRVRITSRAGSVDIEVEATDDIMPGVVSLPHGWGHGRTGVRLGIAAQHAGVSVNDLTDDRFSDPVSGNAALNGVPVQVSDCPD
jgi:anaerobic selenocysteine-containing dehydrogenase